MPYWLLVLHDGFANLVANYVNGFVFLLESLGVSHAASVDLATGVTVAMLGALVVWVWAKVKAMLRRGAEAARQRLRRQTRAASTGGD